ncbi:MAG: glycosyltransferase family 4 protein [Vicinamibacterales bacterium]
MNAGRLRILLATDGIEEPGGVDTYLAAVARGLMPRGHAVAVLHHNTPAPAAGARWPAVERFGLPRSATARTFAAAEAWRPDVCFAHNMSALEVEEGLVQRWPVVKMMHGYFGTCISGQKSFGFPWREPCDRRFGRACLAMYLPRRCGQRSPAVMIRQYAWARAERALFDRYAAVVVASQHMRREFVRNGLPERSLHVIPLFAPACGAGLSSGAGPSATRSDHILFLGRMTPLKGGDLLIEAVAEASRRLGRQLALTMAGDGPELESWRALAARLGVAATFPGWLDPAARDEAIRQASLLAVPSVWPEPFGLTGLEAAAHGVPAVAFDVGGIREWLTHGESGLLAEERRPHAPALASAIVDALGDPSTLARLGDGARRTAARMTLDLHLDRLEAVLGTARGTRNEAPYEARSTRPEAR